MARNDSILWIGDNTSQHIASSSEAWTVEPRGARCPGLEWQQYMELVVVPIFVILGLVGNALSFLVLFSPVYSRKSYSYYLRALAIFDSLTLITSSVISFNSVVFKLSEGNVRFLGNHTALTCKLSEYLRHCIYLMSSWLIVCFTIDRYIAVCHPLQRARLCTRSGALATLAVLMLAVCLSQIYILVLIERVPRSDANLCHAHRDQRLLYFGLYYFLFSFSLRFALPFLIIVTFNGLIVYHIARMRSNGLCQRRQCNAGLAICTLFVVCIVFVATLLPNAVIAMLQFIAFTFYGSFDLFCPLLTLNAPFRMLRLVNYSSNFLLYGVTGRQFRREVRKLLCCTMFAQDRTRGLPPMGYKAVDGQYAMQLLQSSSKPTRKCHL
ncbi:hypothetical protein CAPTEDRAFT_186062 [Capitella teleta]|uniref:G-protein coupled receptors family 1 profile domain-containing protein n=1 Tax=Capitella teleta TaxID=283909 RepID=R7UEY3_CAPTE|nr:hypothetical protein CAPTEDRAFT_186062 [Capitella teleta]|eukprot:ELU04775.1 hypothetical protein CAPTEDRAFT_186062 [Capitella teleta]